MAQNKQTEPKEWLRRFAQYLTLRNIITPGDLKKVLRFQAEIDRRIGQLAALKGYITPKDVIFIVASQADLNLRFGEIAIEKGLMTQEQIATLLDLQNNPFKLFVECLLFTRVISESELRTLIKEFLEHGNITLLPEDPRADETPQPIPAPVLDRELYKMSRGKVQRVVKKIKNFATLPAIVQRILSLLADPDVMIEEIAKVIESDPPLSARMLKLVNSAFFSRRTKVNSVRKAVVTLGFRGIRQMVMTSTMIEQFKEIPEEKTMGIWRHSFLTAQWARALFAHQGARGEALEDASMGGLLHDIGRLVIFQSFPNLIPGIERLMEKGQSRLRAEEQVLTMPHTQIGAFLCHFWKFPGAITQPISYHHASLDVLKALRNKQPLTDVVNAACRLAHLKLAADTRDELDYDGIAGLDGEFLEFHDLLPGDVYSMGTQVLKESNETIAFIFGKSSAVLQG